MRSLLSPLVPRPARALRAAVALSVAGAGVLPAVALAAVAVPGGTSSTSGTTATSPTAKAPRRTLTARPTGATTTPTTTAVATTYGAGGSGGFLHMTVPNYADIAKAHVLVLQQHQHAMIPKIKAANPSVKIYFYSNIMAASETAGTGSFQPSVITWPQLAAHPEWRLRDSAGTATAWRDYWYLRPFDAGNPAVQQAAVTNLKAELQAHAWDGVLLDDVNADITGHDWTTKPVNFTGGSQWAATTSFLKAVAPAVRATGKQVAINAQVKWDLYKPQAQTWAPLVDVFSMEHYSTWTDSTAKPDSYYQGGLDAQWRLDAMRLVQAGGTRVWAHDYGNRTDTRAQAYHRALFLMGWDGRSQSASMWTPSPTSDSWFNATGTLDLGTPKAAASSPQQFVYQRPFAKGTLYLNTTGASVTVSTAKGALTLAPFATAVR